MDEDKNSNYEKENIQTEPSVTIMTGDTMEGDEVKDRDAVTPEPSAQVTDGDPSEHLIKSQSSVEAAQITAAGSQECEQQFDDNTDDGDSNLDDIDCNIDDALDEG